MQRLCSPSRHIPPGIALSASEVAATCIHKSRLSVGVLGPEQPYGGCDGVRLVYDEALDSGHSEFARIADDCIVAVHKRYMPCNVVSKAAAGGWISAHFRIAGESTHLFGDVFEMQRRGPSCTLVAYPPGMENCEWFSGGHALASVALLFKPSFLVETLGATAQRLPLWLRGGREPSEFAVEQISLTRSMFDAVEALINVTYAGRLRFAYVQAKAVELACLVTVEHDRQLQRTGAPVLLQRDQDRVYKARQYLLEHISESVPISDLARRVGTNRNKLQQGFRELFGVTIYDFLQRERMQKARELLAEGQLSIIEISYAVGYQHPRNFTAAFKSWFGVLPKQARRADRATGLEESSPGC